MIRLPAPVHGVELILADLDGVLYKGNKAITNASDSIKKAQRLARVGFITNNASRSAEDVAAHLKSLGFSARSEEIVTSSQAAVRMLSRLVEPGSLVLVVGGPGLRQEIESKGFRITQTAASEPDAVLQGFSVDVDWTQLAEASFALQNQPEIPWIATNTDWTFPLERGVAPGNGAMVSAVHLATGRLATFAGKPEKEIFDVALERFQVHGKTLLVGDRLDTDVLGANRAGMQSALVLTGIDSAKALLAADTSMRPDFIFKDLRDLHRPYPSAIRSVDENDVHTVEVGRSVVRRKGNVVRIARAGRKIDLIRAGASAIYDSNLKIFGLEVDPQIYS